VLVRQLLKDVVRVLVLLSTLQIHINRQRIQSKLQITSLKPSKLHRDIGYIPPTDTGSLCLAVDSTHTVVGLFQLLVRWFGTHWQMNSEIRRVISTASNSSLKRSCSALTSVTSALEVIFNVMRSINPRFTYLLTYCTRIAISLISPYTQKMLPISVHHFLSYTNN